MGAGGDNVPFRQLVQIANLRMDLIFYFVLYGFSALSIVNFPLNKRLHLFPEIDAITEVGSRCEPN